MSMADNSTQPEFVIGITVLSVEKLNKPAFCGLLSRHLRPFISITNSNGHNPWDDSKFDDEKFTFGDKFLVPIESNFFTNIYYCICLHIYTKRILGRQAELSWCRIPAADIGSPPVGSARHLSYKLLAKDGSKVDGIVNLEVKLLWLPSELVIGSGGDQGDQLIARGKKMDDLKLPKNKAMGIYLKVFSCFRVKTLNKDQERRERIRKQKKF